MEPKNFEIKGKNLCNMECVDKDKTIYPKTGISQVIANSTNNQTLEDWIRHDPDSENLFNIEASLKDWLYNNYPTSGSVPIATTDRLGIVQIGSGLNITEEGVLSVPEPTPFSTVASFSNLGIIKLGLGDPLPDPFVAEGEHIDPTNRVSCPLRLDENNRAGIVIPRIDWNATDNDGFAKILNQPVLHTVASTGQYDDLEGKPSIPTVSNSVIEIYQNEVRVDRFTLNGVYDEPKQIHLGYNSTTFGGALNIVVDVPAPFITSKIRNSQQEIVVDVAAATTKCNTIIESIFDNVSSFFATYGNGSVAHVYVNFIGEFSYKEFVYNEASQTHCLYIFFDRWNEQFKTFKNSITGNNFHLDVHFSFCLELNYDFVRFIYPLQPWADEVSGESYYVRTDYSGIVKGTSPDLIENAQRCSIQLVKEASTEYPSMQEITGIDIRCGRNVLHNLNIEYSVSHLDGGTSSAKKYCTLYHYHSSDIHDSENNFFNMYLPPMPQ